MSIDQMGNGEIASSTLDVVLPWSWDRAGLDRRCDLDAVMVVSWAFESSLSGRKSPGVEESAEFARLKQ